MLDEMDTAPRRRAKLLRAAGLTLLLVPYVLYILFVIQADRGPVDYETFMGIGGRLLNGQEVYGENSYYPMPFVMVFALFRWLPRPASMAIWLLLPVIVALATAHWRPQVLLLAPVLSHFLGGQAALFGLLGLWGYRRHTDPESAAGGMYLALTMIKPQLGLIPLAFAAAQWWRSFRERRRLPRQAWVWGATMAVLFLPSLAIAPGWPMRWLGQPRPLFERAMSGLVPRALLMALPSRATAYWLSWIVLSALLLWAVWALSRRMLSLDLLVLWGFVVSPLVHDYDLIQAVPLLESRMLRRVALLLSVPGLWVILFAYTNDKAWLLFALFAPGLLCALLIQCRQEASRTFGQSEGAAHAAPGLCCRNATEWVV